jgi:uncharacterized protein
VSGLVNATAPLPVSNAQLTTILASALHKRPFFAVPKFALKIAVGEMAEALLSSQRCSSEKIMKHGFQFQYLDFAQAVTNLCAYSAGRLGEHVQ